jgi:hypothetical protein
MGYWRFTLAISYQAELNLAGASTQQHEFVARILCANSLHPFVARIRRTNSLRNFVAQNHCTNSLREFAVRTRCVNSLREFVARIRCTHSPHEFVVRTLWSLMHSLHEFVAQRTPHLSLQARSWEATWYTQYVVQWILAPLPIAISSLLWLLPREPHASFAITSSSRHLSMGRIHPGSEIHLVPKPTIKENSSTPLRLRHSLSHYGL